MKTKMLFVPALAFAFVMTASVAFAHEMNGQHIPNYRRHSTSFLKIDVDNENTSYVKNDVTANSNTGYNTVNGSHRRHHNGNGLWGGGWNGGGSSIVTGNASAVAGSETMTGGNDTEITIPCDCLDGRKGSKLIIEVENKNKSAVKNYVTANANTGYNTVNGGGSITTGDADAMATSWTVTGSNVTVIK